MKALSISEAEAEAKNLAHILQRDGAEAAQAAFEAYVKANEVGKTGQKTLRKCFRLAAGIESTPIKPDSALAEAQEREAAEATLPPEVQIAPAEDPTLADPPTDEKPAEDPTEATPADVEAAYGKQALADLLKDQEGFVVALSEGIEPAIADAIYAALIRPTRKGRASENIPVIRTSTIDSPCKAAWELYSQMEAEINGIPNRALAISKAVALGIATGTARTQFQEWSKAKAPEWLKKGWLK